MAAVDSSAALAAAADGSGPGLIRRLAASELTEQDARRLFAQYESDPEAGRWSADDARRFVTDLLQSFGAPPVVPDEVVSAVVLELQLNVEAPEGVSWLEFKSYCLFLQNGPLDALFRVAARVVPSAHLEHAAVLAPLPAGTTRAQVEALVSPVAAGGLLAVYAGETEALVACDSAASLARVLSMNGSRAADGRLLLSARAYSRGEVYPPPRAHATEPSRPARGLAKVIVGAQALDSRIGASQTVRRGADMVVERIGALSDAPVVRDISSAVSSTAHEVDAQFDLSGKGRAVGAAVSSTAAQVAATPAVQAATSFFSDLFTRVSSVVQEGVRQTSAAVAAERTRQGVAAGAGAAAAGNAGGEGAQVPVAAAAAALEEEEDVEMRVPAVPSDEFDKDLSSSSESK